MSKQKTNIENENKDAKFRRIANPRIKKLIYETERLIKMAHQPTYDIFDVDAQKILDVLAPKLEELLTIYQKIADGQTIKTTGKQEIKDVF